MHEILEEYFTLYRELCANEKEKIPLCAAETYVSDFVKSALNSHFEGKYSAVDSSGTDSFIGGGYVARLNSLLNRECYRLFNSTYVNADTLTGINCLTVAVMSVLSPGDEVLLTTPEQGGHPSVPAILNMLGIKYRSIPYDFEKFQINYKETNKLIENNNFKCIIFCQSDLLQPPEIENINVKSDIRIIYDATQTLGLIVSKCVPNPLLSYKNTALIGGTHKTLPAPSCGLIMTNDEVLADRFKQNIHPTLLRNTQPNHIAALLLALVEQEIYGEKYQRHVIEVANKLGRELSNFGFDVIRISENKYSNTHQLFIRLSQTETELFFKNALKYNVTINKKHKKLFNNFGIRLGTQQIARYNWQDIEIKKLAKLLYMLHTEPENSAKILNLRRFLIQKKIPNFELTDMIIE